MLIFAFGAVLLVFYLKNHYQMLKSFPPTFCSRSFTVWGLAFNYLIHFELICEFNFLHFFIYFFYSFPNALYFSTGYSWLSFPRWVSLAPLYILVDHISINLFLGSQFFHYPICLFLCQYISVVPSCKISSFETSIMIFSNTSISALQNDHSVHLLK